MNGEAAGRRAATRAPIEPIAAYKRLIKAMLDLRPSGTRRRIASELGTAASFVTQITSPAYPAPLPRAHLATILSVAHASAAERQAILAAYAAAHPRRMALVEGTAAPRRRLVVELPDLGSEERNRALDELITDHARRLARLVGQLG